MTESQQTTPATTASDRPLSDRPAQRLGEPGLLRYGRLLWKRRLMILVGSILPTLGLACAIHFWPLRYTTTFVYERPLMESEYNVLLRRFYSSENLDKIVARLREKGVTGYALKLETAQTEQALHRLIRFSVSPAYPTRLQTTDPTTSEEISKSKAQLLSIAITGDSEDEMGAVSEAVTDNFERVLPVYEIRKDLIESIQEIEELAAEIADSRFSQTIELQKEKTRLQQLSSLPEAPSEGAQSNVVLQFTEVAESREFLPLALQRDAVQSKIIDLQETLNSEEEMYSYYLKVLAMNGRLLGEIEGRLLVYYTVPEFLAFLNEQMQACDENTMVDYLKSYIRKTQGLMLVNTRAGEQPIVYPVSKHTLKRAVLALIVFLMIMTFVAVVQEYGQERQHPADSPKPAG